MSRPVMTSEAREMRDMARHGHSQETIARAFGRARSVVHYHCGDLLKKSRGATRWSEMVTAYEATPRDQRGALAERYGLASVASLTTAYCRARRGLAANEART